MITGKPLFNAEQISQRVKELGQLITEETSGKNLLAVGILKGAFMFFSDLVKHIKTPLTIDFIIASSYIKTSSTGEVKVYHDISENISDKDVLLIDDIVDTGVTMNYIRERILARSPKSLRICAFLDKKERRLVDVPIDYKGFVIPNEFVVGYGLDYNNMFRNLPYISIFKKNI